MREWYTRDRKMEVLRACESRGIKTWHLHYNDQPIEDFKRNLASRPSARRSWRRIRSARAAGSARSRSRAWRSSSSARGAPTVHAMTWSAHSVLALGNIKATDAVIVGMYPRFKDEMGENPALVRRTLS
jgi:hypothetical protein